VRPRGFAGRTQEYGREDRDLYGPWRPRPLVGEPAFRAFRGEGSFAVCWENRTGGWTAAPAFILVRNCGKIYVDGVFRRWLPSTNRLLAPATSELSPVIREQVGRDYGIFFRLMALLYLYLPFELHGRIN